MVGEVALEGIRALQLGQDSLGLGRDVEVHEREVQLPESPVPTKQGAVDPELCPVHSAVAVRHAP